MGEEVRTAGFEVNENGDCNGDDERILDWEMGLPNGEDLTPLSQSLIPPELASAFSISPIPYRTLLDVNRESQTTLSSIRGGHALSSTNNNNSSNNNNNIKSFTENRDLTVIEADEPDQNGSGTDSRSKSRKLDCTEEADSALRTDNSNEDPSAGTQKRPRLVWTPQLHKRFVDVVAHLGIKNAVPKTIMQLMNVEGLTRENVASHLQKYRLYLKRMQGLSNDDPSSSDHQLFASTPVPPQCLHYESANGGPHGGPVSNNSNNNNGNSSNNNNGNSNNGNGNKGHVGMPTYGTPPGMMSVPIYGMMNHQGFHHGHGFEPSMYNMNMNMGMCMNMNMSMGMNNMTHHQRDWSMNQHGHGSVVPYQHSSDK